MAAQDANMEMELCKNLILPNIILNDYPDYNEEPVYNYEANEEYDEGGCFNTANY